MKNTLRTLPFLFIFSTCISRTSTQRNNEDNFSESIGSRTEQSVTAQKSLSAQNLTTLFPIDRTALQRTTTNAEAVKVASQFLPPLSAVLSDANYKQILQLATRTEASENNPLSEFLAAEIKAIPLSNWFIVGVRFVPCDADFYIPQDWLLEKKSDYLNLCRPTIRLSVQPFGSRDENDSLGMPKRGGASDDKSLHLVYNYNPNLPIFKEILTSEHEFNRKMFQNFTTEFVKNELVNLLSQTKLNTARKALQTSVISELKSIEGFSAAFSSANISTTPPALWVAGLKKYLTGTFLKTTQLKKVTQNFSATGAGATTDNSWIFASYHANECLPKTNNCSFQKDPLKVLSVVKNASGATTEIAGVLDSGKNENFQVSMGSQYSFDLELLKSLSANSKLSDSFVNHSGGHFFTELVDGKVSDNPNTQPEVEFSQPFRQQQEGKIQLVNSATKHSNQTLTCTSCHIATGNREFLKLGFQQKYKIDNNRILDMKVALNQSQMNSFWNMRQLGYFGPYPSIAERVIEETLFQISLL